MSKITITLEDNELTELIFAAAQSSCAFDRNSLKERQMWHLHCCDYNHSINEVLKQINLDDIEDLDYKEYLETAIEKGKELFQ